MKTHKKTYFISDVHLGYPDFESSLQREKRLVQWLNEIKNDAEAIYFLGDIFEYWYEYKHVAPQGFIRFLGKLAEITDSGIPVHFFTGNHDIWVFDYLPRETGVKIYRNPLQREINGKKFYLAHGDGLGPSDRRFKLMKRMFTNRFLQWLFAKVHPDYTIGMAHRWSNRSRKQHKKTVFLGKDKEWLIIHALNVLESEHFDYFIFGHRHLALHIPLADNSEFINLGDWITHYTYAVFDGENVSLEKYAIN